MSAAKSIAGGVAGTLVLNLLHESIRKVVPGAPRIDQLGMQLIKNMSGNGTSNGDTNDKGLYFKALAGDIVGNSLFYSLIGSGKKAWLRGLLFGVGAGIAVATLPKYFGLDPNASSKTPATAAMTIGLYTLAGLAAGGVQTMLENKKI